MSDLTCPWESSYREGISWGEPLKLSTGADYLAEANRRWPTKMAIKFNGEAISYGQLWSLADRAAEGFRRLGVRRGVNVAVLVPNSPHHVIACFGVFMAGGTVVNLSVDAGGREIEGQLVDTEVEILVSAMLGPLGDKVRGFIGATPVRTLVLCGVDRPVAEGLSPLQTEAVAGTVVMGLDDLARGDPPSTAPSDGPALDDIALIQFTGGTTGSPKGAMLRHANISAAAELSRRWLGPIFLDEDRRCSLGLPLAHIFGFYTLLTCFVTGTPVYLHGKFSPFAVVDEFEREKITIFFGVPTMYAAMTIMGLVNAENTASLQICGVGGAPLTQALERSFREATGHRLREGYGLSETAANGVWQPAQWAPKPGATGLPLPLTTIDIVDLETGETVLPPGEMGEVCFSGPQVMAGYWKRPQETAIAFRGGRFHTGDIGILEKDGYLTLIDRKKDMILAGGFNVFPSTVEAALCEHPVVAEAAVVGVKDAFMGQLVKAYLRCRPDMKPVSFEEVIAFLYPRLASFEIPVAIEWRAELPKTYVGKLARNQLVDTPDSAR